MTNPTSYDVVAYPGHPRAQTHPDRLAVIGSLFGLSPAPVTGCRVLELGCGDGANLLPMACALPGSSFVGVDLAPTAIAQGRAAIDELALPNIRLVCGNVAELDGGLGRFDYIMAHGLFSWVPPEVRERLLGLCRECLAPQGVAFVSYNALPGFHFRTLVREMMLFHVRHLSEPGERLGQAMALVRFLADGQSGGTEDSRWLKAELEDVRDHEPGHLFHDELAEINTPFYFTQFVELAARHGLKYLGEADYAEMFDSGFNEPTRAVLRQLSGNRILREQYLDFLKCRRFRQTLLCHAEAPATAEPLVEKVEQFLVSSRARPNAEAVDLGPGKIVSYATARGASCATDFPLGKAALEALDQPGPAARPFETILAEAAARLAGAGIQHGGADPRRELAGFLLNLHGAGLVGFRTWLPAAALQAGERPRVSALARWQIQRQNWVTSQFHLAIQIEDEIGRLLLRSLDGTQDRNAVLEKVLALLESRNALPPDAGDAAAVRRKVAEDLEQNLAKLARFGLLAD